MNLKQNSIEDLSRLCLKNSKSLENIREKVMRMSKLTSLDRSTVIPAAPLKQKVLESKGLSETKNGLPVCTDMIQDAFDSLSPQITSLNAKSTLKYLKSHHYQLQEHIEALESYIKYRDMPFSTIFRLESRLPIPKRLQAPDRKVELFVIGQNDDGQLGLSKELFMATTKFRKPSGVEEIETLACGSMHSVVVDKTGDVYTFGLEDCIGRDGVDDQINKLNLPSKALQVCCGEYFTAILDITGTVFYFGGFRNRNGKRLYFQKYPTKLEIDLPVVKIASGESHLIILCQDMSCYVVGVAEHGQGMMPCSTPTPIKLFVIEPVLDVYAAGFSSFFMTPSGLYGTGNNGYGELGIGLHKKSFHPQALQLSPETVVVDISGGLHHTLFLDCSGNVWVAGKNFDGQCGLPVDVESVCTPVQVDIQGARYPIRKIAAGTSSHHSYVIDSEGSLFCAGQNEYGQLGLSEETIISFRKIDLKKRKVVQVSGGCQFSILGLTDRL